MKTDASAPSPSRRLLACCGFVACWLGAAVTGFQATVGDGPNRSLRIEQPAPAPIETGEEPQNGVQEAPRAKAGGAHTATREYWR